MLTPASIIKILEKLPDHIYNEDIDYVSKKEAFEAKDDVKKIVFATILDAMEGRSKAAKEIEAYKTSQWHDFIKELGELRREAMYARARRDKLVREFETYRSILSIKRKEMEVL